jgi:sulfur carrier protein
VIEVVVNGEALRVPPGASVRDVVHAYAPGSAGAAGPAGGIAVALAETVVPAGAWDSTTVAAGDRLEVLGAVAGG